LTEGARNTVGDQAWQADDRKYQRRVAVRVSRLDNAGSQSLLSRSPSVTRVSVDVSRVCGGVLPKHYKVLCRMKNTGLPLNATGYPQKSFSRPFDDNATHWLLRPSVHNDDAREL
jgi:hypothetical protein